MAASKPGVGKDGKLSQAKMEKTMGEFKRGTLHSGSKDGPKVKSRPQAIAIGLSQARSTARKDSVRHARSA